MKSNLMKLIFGLSFFILIFLGIVTKSQVFAQENSYINLDEILFKEASNSTDASVSGKLASASAEIEQKIQEKKDQDITETGGKQKSVLASYLDEHPIKSLNAFNFLQHGIRKAIERGLPANIIVLLILFPIIASAIAASRHIIGLQGFGIYIPAVLSVAFVSTGLLTGITIFIVVMGSSIISRNLVSKLKLPYLPRTAMLLWGVTFLTLIILIGSSFFDFFSLLNINIFPLLIIILLTENFMESEVFNSQKEAFRLTLETLFIAVVCSVIIGADIIQKFVILRPEITLISVIFINTLIGRYKGLRLLEYLRFNAILEKNHG